MTQDDPILDPLFVESYNADLEALNSPARIAITTLSSGADVFELLDDEGQFVTLFPASATPEVTAAAYRLYAQGLHRGLRTGEELAWGKLRHLIGAASDER
ncbi:MULTISPECIES: hypothetical protein [Novosphingobium]|uniref:Uncharacterized protein n=1 Tax=Novosphingobium mangrovi (ex Huang et al. 2023) TaxID=2976432 RepID=A0ABT2I5J2_9SPHN|nr:MULTISPECIES: hypothetical protein [Novosphingobium]MCT2400076.1 hypothetical protein [Novosphingobium mangrovi (ex Huang et al. 2023)]CCA93073.1 putative uncharacterized protein [Novosphingobium sp. PP1Y]